MDNEGCLNFLSRTPTRLISKKLEWSAVPKNIKTERVFITHLWSFMCLGNVPTWEKFRWEKSKCRISDVIIYVVWQLVSLMLSLSLTQRTTGYVLSIHSNEKAQQRSPTKNGLYVFMFISSYSSHQHHHRRRRRCRHFDVTWEEAFFGRTNFAYFFFSSHF